jgi:nitrite reductase/ring-hydroxylating ferredoxin subunit
LPLITTALYNELKGDSSFDKGGLRMSEWQRLCGEQEVAIGTGKRIEVAGRHLLVAHVEGGFFAVDADCPHMGGDLARGRIEGSRVVCPRHGATYDLATGKMVKDVGSAIHFLTRKSAADIRSYPVKLENGSLLANLD